MKKVIATGVQDYEMMISENRFYVDKTDFISEWWNGGDAVTLITRPRRFGKTLNLSMMNCFFSLKYAHRGDLFEGLKVWEEEAFRKLQGTFPVIFLSFAGVKQTSYENAVALIKMLIVQLFSSFPELYSSDKLNENERILLRAVSREMDDVTAAFSLNLLSTLLEKHYGMKALIFLDEYDTPLQEAWLAGYWDELVSFMRSMFNNTFKTNPSLHRAILTGITRVSRESIFSDLNNLVVVTTTSRKYATAFGFTEGEVFQALKEQGFAEAEKEKTKAWYDGFTFGGVTDIYNPWSICNLLDTGEFKTYWANSSGNSLVGTLIQQGNRRIKESFETLLKGGTLEVALDEEIVYSQLDENPEAIWSLLLASGYLKVLPDPRMMEPGFYEREKYLLALTNWEIRILFEKMVKGWFRKAGGMGEFIRAMLQGDAEAMEEYLDQIMIRVMSSFDAQKEAGDRTPERFYHGLVLGLLVEEQGDYVLRSNRESGFGRYDVVLDPRDPRDPAVILEFKVFNGRRGEQNLEDTAVNALRQIEEKRYDADLLARGIPAENILKYGLAFRGKECLIRKL